MTAATRSEIDVLTATCIDAMGDIFWDYNPDRHQSGDYSDPTQVAARAIKHALSELAKLFLARELQIGSSDYEAIINALRDDRRMDAVGTQLAQVKGWTRKRTSKVIELAEDHNVDELSVALALARAMHE